MNNKGFTLIELVATIGLLAVISIISYVSINKVLEESKISECEQLVMSIKSAAKEYFSDYRYDINLQFSNSEENIEYPIYGDSLVGYNYLNGSIINPCNGEDIEVSSIKVILNVDRNYSIVDTKVVEPDILTNCVCE